MRRRGFLASSLAVAVGAPIPFAANLRGTVPLALAAEARPKPALTLLGERPFNAETPPHLLDDAITPTPLHFVRNNGIPPPAADPGSWTLTLDGHVERPLELRIADLKRRFEVVRAALVIECAGNGRAFFEPPVRGNQWTYGAIGCSRWTGVRLADLLALARVKPDAVYTAHEGADAHLSGAASRQAISRGIPIAKAVDPSVLIAFEQNDAPIPPLHGAPLRLVVPGWPGSCSQKWLTRIQVRDQIHDGAKMTGSSYRVPAYGVAPGTKVPDADMRIIETMPVKSLITSPASGRRSPAPSVAVRGHAWAGDRTVASVELSRDFGASWQPARLQPPVNRHAWQRFSATVDLPLPGYYEIWAKATDDAGISQPFAIDWNPKGYLNNGYHRISVVRT